MKSNKSLFIVLTALFLFSVAMGQKQTPPEGGKPKDFVLPKKQTFMLPNGLRVTMVPYGSLPKVTVRVTTLAGNNNENENQIWLSDLMGEYLKEGTKSRSAQQISEDAATMGGNVNVSVGLDQMWVGGDVLSEFAPNLVELLADIIQNPSFPEKEIERLKRDMLRTLSIQKSQPQAMAQEKFMKVLFGNHPYGNIFPTEQMVQDYKRSDVEAFYTANVGAQRSQVYVVGMFDGKKVEAAIRNAFGKWGKGPEPYVNIPKPMSKRAVYLLHRPGAAQSTIYMGLPIIDPSHPDYLKLLVTNALLGGSFASRITSNIRENKGYTYSPFSTVSTFYRAAYWAEVADVTTDVTGASLKEIFYEIDRLQSEVPSKDELAGIQNYMAGTFVLQNSSRGGIIGQLSFLSLHGLPDSYLTGYVKKVHAVTPHDVQRIAQTYLRDEEMTIVIAGDRGKIEPQVSPYGQIME
ncbi:MAG TPA: pitrilysin family protein [Bacteroidota bacterium]|nr:pitrilysin family protein [Bacteroidota bacterium]